MTLPDITSWKLEVLRLTVFLADQLSDNECGKWKRLTGQDPESVTTRPQTGEYVEDGVFQSCRLSYSANMLGPFRIDWIMYPQVNEASAYQSIGGYIEETKRFFDIFEQWIKNDCPPAIRLAYGVNMFHEVPNKKLGYETLANCLPHINFDIDNWSDFLFQVNNLSTSKTVDNLKLNRISRWMTSRSQRITMSPSGLQSLNDNYACRAEFDLSTSEENKSVFTSANMIALFTELKNIADQYAAHGLQK